MIIAITTHTSTSFTTQPSFITKTIPATATQSDYKIPISRSSTTKTTQLFESSVIIEGTTSTEEFDERQGGVGLASENVIKISGSNNGSGVPQANDITLYTQLTPLDDKVNDASVICTGNGNDNLSVDNMIYAPSDAVRDALSNIKGDASTAKKIVINFVGGDDLKPLQVSTALEELIAGLSDVVKSDTTNIEFHSLSFNTFPEEVCTVTVIAAGESDVSDGDDAATSLDKSLANGEMYFHTGKWYTVIDSDINTDEE